MKLSRLTKAVPGSHGVLSDPDISSIHYRADSVQPGGLFVAIQGLQADGHDYIDEALANGAAAIVVQKPVKKDSIIIEVENTRKALALISSMFYRNPSKKMSIIGITGTNGKTTTTFLVESILEKAGFCVGVIGTINYRYSGKIFDNPMTTPESLDLQKILAEMEEEGISHVVMEVSSHAIDLNRIDGCRFDIGVFTNLSRDHLDFHGNMNAYWSCKKRLFTEHFFSASKKELPLVVLNCNDPKGMELKDIPDLNCLCTGFSKENAIRPDIVKSDLNGFEGRIFTPDGMFEFKSPLVGDYNLENILCATGVGVACNLPLEIVRAGIESFSGVPGRLERVFGNSKQFVFVDYAHTPDALENVLSTLKSKADGRLICVFGCGGDRDKTKRPCMGKIAYRFSDLAVITSDNPRTETPKEIINQIVDGIKKYDVHEYNARELTEGFKEKGYTIEPDRRRAIKIGITSCRNNDTVLIAGKGHETYQIIGKEKTPFDDRTEARKALQERFDVNESTTIMVNS